MYLEFYVRIRVHNARVMFMSYKFAFLAFSRFSICLYCVKIEVVYLLYKFSIKVLQVDVGGLMYLIDLIEILVEFG